MTVEVSSLKLNVLLGVPANAKVVSSLKLNVVIGPATGPTISSIAPDEGYDSGGTSVTITGALFTGATGVLFGASSATSVVVVDESTITCVTPSGTPGSVDVTVQHPDGDAVVEDGFTYIEQLPPAITSIAPEAGSLDGGTEVTITGTDFTGATGVEFGGVAATSVIVVNSTTITCVTPAGTGTVDVTVLHPLGDDTLEDAFTYINEARVTQVPLLVVHKPVQEVRVTQVPLLVVSLPVQAARITQVPVLPIWAPKPVPFPLPIVPEVPLKEVWQWKTVTNIFESGKEQRAALRMSPRMSMKFSAAILDDGDRRYVYDMLLKYVRQTFNYPMYVHSAKLSAAASASDTKLYFNPAATDLRDGEAAALFDPQFETTQYISVDTVDEDGATLSSGLESDVPAHFYICAAPKFLVIDPSFSMLSVSGNLELNLVGAQVRDVLRPDQSTTLTKIDGMVLLDIRPLADDNIPEVFDQDVSWLDSGIADPVPLYGWLTPLLTSEMKFLVHRPFGLDIWRAIAEELRGNQNPFLVPTFRDDLPVIEQPALSAVKFKTDRVQFFDIWRSNAWRYVRIQSDAGVIYRKIAEVVANYDDDGDAESLTIELTESIGSATGSNTNMVVSFVNTVRMNSDEIVIEHGPVDSVLSMKIKMVEA